LATMFLCTQVRCDYCRQKRRKCDRKVPCSTCVKSNKGFCTYSTPPTGSVATKFGKKFDLMKIQTQLVNVAARRRYFDSYLEGLFTPSFLFVKSASSCYDFPTTSSRALQYNSILASVTRSFGASYAVYNNFEKEALSAVKQVLIDFTYETALGFHFLAVHYWGSDESLCSHFIDITLSICKQAVKQPKNARDLKNIISLTLVTLTLNDASRISEFQDILEDYTKSFTAYSPNTTLESLGLQGQIFFVSFISKLLSVILPSVGLDNKKYFTKISQEQYLSLHEEMKAVHKASISSVTSETTQKILLGLYLIVMGVLEFLGGTHAESFYFKELVSLFTENEYLIRLGGPRFVGFFDAAFTAMVLGNHLDLANQMAGVLLKQSEYFPIASNSALESMKILKYVNESSTSTSSSIRCTPSPPESDPFGSVVQLTRLPTLDEFVPTYH